MSPDNKGIFKVSKFDWAMMSHDKRAEVHAIADVVPDKFHRFYHFFKLKPKYFFKFKTYLGHSIVTNDGKITAIVISGNTVLSFKAQSLYKAKKWIDKQIEKGVIKNESKRKAKNNAVSIAA